MVVYLIQMLTFFVKTKNMKLTSIEKRPSVGFLPTSKIFISETCNIGLIRSLFFQCLSLYSDFIKFHHEIDKLISILRKNSYLHNFFVKCIKQFLDKVLAPKRIVSTVPKKDLIIALLYLGKSSLPMHQRINSIMKTKSRSVCPDCFPD